MAQKKETTEASVSSQAAGVKGKGSANALAAKLKTRRLRTAVGAVVFVGMAAGLVAGVSMGTMSGFGWDTFSMLCPLGALGTMIATKTMIPRAVVSLVLIAALVLVFAARSARGCARPCSSTASATSSARPRNAAS